MLSLDGTYSLMEDLLVRLGILEESSGAETPGSRLPEHVKLLLAGSGLGRDIAAVLGAMANAVQLRAHERPLSSITALHVPSLRRFILETEALAAR